MNPKQSYLRKNYFVGEAPPLNVAGRELKARVYRTNEESPRDHVLFLDEDEPPTQQSTRLGMRLDVGGGGICLLGMYVNGRMRGSGAGKAIAQYFLDFTANELGTFPLDTATIRKPLIALSLERTGFVARPGGIRVGILPELKNSRLRAPRIMCLPDGGPMPSDVIHRSDAGEFYHLVTQTEVGRLYPVEQPFTPITIHTRYSPPK